MHRASRTAAACLAVAVCVFVAGAGVCREGHETAAILRAERPPDPGACEEALADANALYLPLAQSLSPQDGYPRNILYGVDWNQTPPYQWTSGFFPGILWQLYEFEESPELLEQAQRWTEPLEEQTTAPSHDVGLVINNSFGRGHRVTGEAWYRDVTLEAANHLATRFDSTVGAIRSWGSMERFSYPVIIDNMMSLEILYWAARNGGDESLAEIATTHAMTTMRDHVRDDGTTFHLVDYEQATGEIIWRGTVQGLADTSVWARGQAWAVYGFSMAYRESREPEFLSTACRLADAFLERLPEDRIPCWDFDAADIPGEPKDASAAAIAASGLWELASLVEDVGRRDRYREASVELVESLSSEDYSAQSVGLPAMLLHSTGNRPRYTEVDVPLIYAEYYYIEALARQAASSEDPSSGTLLSSYPNPISSDTRIRYQLQSPGNATIRIYDPSGRLVCTLTAPSQEGRSSGSVRWCGCDAAGRVLAAGVYFARLEAGEETAVHKMVLLK